MVAIINTLFTGLIAILALNTVTGANAAAPSYGFIKLGKAGPFGALSAAGITNVGNTAIKGKIGTTGVSITGFNPPGKYTGTKEINNAAATTAFAAYTKAFTFGQGLIPTADKTATPTLGGEVLTAGVYKYGAALGLTGSVTFDAAGDSTSVWVIQIGSALTTAASSNMILLNGAKATNIFWIIGSSATLGATSVVQGSMLAYASITTGAGSNIHGGLYAGAAITLDSTIITAKPGTVARRALSFRA